MDQPLKTLKQWPRLKIDGIENGKIKKYFAMADFTRFMQQFAKK